MIMGKIMGPCFNGSQSTDMVGNNLRKTLTLLACIFVGFLIFYRKDFTHENENLLFPLRKDLPHENSHINRGTCVLPELTNFDQFYEYFDKPKAACSNMVQVGGITFRKGIIDGDKWVCFDKDFKPDHCVVYSFGINNEWSFDDAMDRKHCQVFSFDPTMGAKDHRRSPRILFYNLGISNYTGYTKMRRKDCKMDTYRKIVEMLGHSSTIIDYFKMDIEAAEIPVFKDILDNDLELLDNVMQIGMEVHPGKPSNVVTQRLKDNWEVFHRLECLGWRLLYAEKNKVTGNHFQLNGTLRSTCYEAVWIKT